MFYLIMKRIRRIKEGVELILARHELFVFVGFLMVLGTLAKLLGYADFSSDWFWFIAGCGLVVEGFIMTAKQRKFDKKFKIIERESY